MPKRKKPEDLKTSAMTVSGEPKDPSLGGGVSKADDEKLKIIANTLRLGAHFEIASALAGITAKTLRNYMVAARTNPDSIYGKYLTEITAALAQAEIRDLSVIDQAAQGRPAEYLMIAQVDSKGDPIRDAFGKVIMKAQLDDEGKPIKIRNEQFPSWQASAWKLERKAPKRWGRYDRVQIDDISDFDDDPRERKTEEERISQGEVEARVKRLKRIKTVLDAVPEDTDLGDV